MRADFSEIPVNKTYLTATHLYVVLPRSSRTMARLPLGEGRGAGHSLCRTFHSMDEIRIAIDRSRFAAGIGQPKISSRMLVKTFPGSSRRCAGCEQGRAPEADANERVHPRRRGRLNDNYAAFVVVDVLDTLVME